MEIHLIRHIEPDFEKGICYGQLDIQLPTNHGQLHQNIKEEISGNYDVIYSSPLTRCKLLAEQISTEVIYDERLKEIHFGDWEGKQWDEIDPKELNYWMKNYISVAPPNGESLNDLILRFSSFQSDLLKQNHSKIMIVTHAGIIRSAMHIFNKTPINQIMMEKVEFGKVIIFNM